MIKTAHNSVDSLRRPMIWPPVWFS